ncbi:SusD/RagB family nutrient-binding outer membrane lipoprotein [Emticicia sp. BO119]|uniref:SusD/RagB family nutrient-binding outer membrane lipoprotein n=1 Tax=Emticicia sp. BO119 TaxID=2757768 RepID=UPI0015F04866|nr:SusD/RagB family nutrient-binding outer membrane lipoprotein [Emticicia sp. BO119]MBA4852347.1 SusD/RagB family nutrient-binding outer membrane lipoprotein [Emticicia sp. BO119]
MKINQLFAGAFAVLAVTLSSCERSFEDLEKDPNRPVNVPASLVLQGVESDLANNTGRPFSAEMRWNQFYCSNYNYYATNEYTWSSTPNHYNTLKNVVKMEEEAKRAGLADVNGYSALGKFFRAYFIDEMTKRVGDIPVSEALKGIENITPKYDNQKAVYVQILKWLEEANDNLAVLITQGQTVQGDFYFGGDLRKWQKAVNAFKLRVLISLSKKEAEGDLNVKTRFAEIIGNPTKYPLFEGLADNLEFKYNQFNKYPSNPDNFGFDATRQNMAKTYVGLLSDLKDPRVMVTCEPAGAALKAGKLPSDYSSFVGASSAEDLADMSEKAGRTNGAGFAPGVYSFQNRYRYYRNYTAENTFIVGYPEMCFNIAEAIHRGWATGDTETWYKKGIQASMSFYGIVNGSNTMTYSKTGGRDAADLANYTVNFNFDTYYAQDMVKYDGKTTKGLQQIISQKYAAFFMNSGMEAYFNWRRTGFPKFETGVGNGNSGRIALRWQYPVSERTTNSKNYNEAIGSQYAGKDDINDSVWIMK